MECVPAGRAGVQSVCSQPSSRATCTASLQGQGLESKRPCAEPVVESFIQLYQASCFLRMLTGVHRRSSIRASERAPLDQALRCTLVDQGIDRGAPQVWLVAADCFFIGLAPVLVHMAKNGQGKYDFHPVAIGFLTECAKLVFASITLLVNVRSVRHPPSSSTSSM